MSSIFNKIITAIRGGAREVGEHVVDQNAIRIYTQEIEDAKNNLAMAKKDLTEVMAKEMQANREIERLSKEISKYEDYAVEALNKGDNTLTEEIAEKVGELDNELVTQNTAKESYSNHVTRLKDLMKKTERTIREHERELSMVKTTASVQKATRSITDNYGNGTSRLLDAKDSLDRIKQKQKNFEDRMSAAEALEAELGTQSLDEKLKTAGIGDARSSTNAALDRIRKRASSDK
jgi:phage shock protein A